MGAAVRHEGVAEAAEAAAGPEGRRRRRSSPLRKGRRSKAQRLSSGALLSPCAALQSSLGQKICRRRASLLTFGGRGAAQSCDEVCPVVHSGMIRTIVKQVRQQKWQRVNGSQRSFHHGS